MAEIEKRQNEAKLLLVLITGALRLMTNQGGFSPENEPKFRAAAGGFGEPCRLWNRVANSQNLY